MSITKEKRMSEMQVESRYNTIDVCSTPCTESNTQHMLLTSYFSRKSNLCRTYLFEETKIQKKITFLKQNAPNSTRLGLQHISTATSNIGTSQSGTNLIALKSITKENFQSNPYLNTAEKFKRNKPYINGNLSKIDNKNLTEATAAVTYSKFPTLKTDTYLKKVESSNSKLSINCALADSKLKTRNEFHMVNLGKHIKFEPHRQSSHCIDNHIDKIVQAKKKEIAYKASKSKITVEPLASGDTLFFNLTNTSNENRVSNQLLNHKSGPSGGKVQLNHILSQTIKDVYIDFIHRSITILNSKNKDLGSAVVNNLLIEEYRKLCKSIMGVINKAHFTLKNFAAVERDKKNNLFQIPMISREGVSIKPLIKIPKSPSKLKQMQFLKKISPKKNKIDELKQKLQIIEELNLENIIDNEEMMKLSENEIQTHIFSLFGKSQLFNLKIKSNLKIDSEKNTINNSIENLETSGRKTVWNALGPNMAKKSKMKTIALAIGQLKSQLKEEIDEISIRNKLESAVKELISDKKGMLEARLDEVNVFIDSLFNDKQYGLYLLTDEQKLVIKKSLMRWITEEMKKVNMTVADIIKKKAVLNLGLAHKIRDGLDSKDSSLEDNINNHSISKQEELKARIKRLGTKLGRNKQDKNEESSSLNITGKIDASLDSNRLNGKENDIIELREYLNKIIRNSNNSHKDSKKIRKIKRKYSDLLKTLKEHPNNAFDNLGFDLRKMFEKVLENVNLKMDAKKRLRVHHKSCKSIKVGKDSKCASQLRNQKLFNKRFGWEFVETADLKIRSKSFGAIRNDLYLESISSNESLLDRSDAESLTALRLSSLEDFNVKDLSKQISNLLINNIKSTIKIKPEKQKLIEKISSLTKNKEVERLFIRPIEDVLETEIEKDREILNKPVDSKISNIEDAKAEDSMINTNLTTNPTKSALMTIEEIEKERRDIEEMKVKFENQLNTNKSFLSKNPSSILQISKEEPKPPSITIKRSNAPKKTEIARKSKGLVINTNYAKPKSKTKPLEILPKKKGSLIKEIKTLRKVSTVSGGKSNKSGEEAKLKSKVSKNLKNKMEIVITEAPTSSNQPININLIKKKSNLRDYELESIESESSLGSEEFEQKSLSPQQLSSRSSSQTNSVMIKESNATTKFLTRKSTVRSGTGSFGILKKKTATQINDLTDDGKPSSTTVKFKLESPQVGNSRRNIFRQDAMGEFDGGDEESNINFSNLFYNTPFKSALAKRRKSQYGNDGQGRTSDTLIKYLKEEERKKRKQKKNNLSVQSKNIQLMRDKYKMLNVAHKRKSQPKIEIMTEEAPKRFNESEREEEINKMNKKAHFLSKIEEYDKQDNEVFNKLDLAEEQERLNELVSRALKIKENNEFLEKLRYKAEFDVSQYIDNVNSKDMVEVEEIYEVSLLKILF